MTKSRRGREDSEPVPAEEWAKRQAEPPEEVKLLRAENQKLRRKLRVTGATTAIIQAAVEEALAGGVDLRIPPRPKRDTRKGADEWVAVAHLSDTQIGKVTETYDSEVAAHRCMEYADKVARILERHRSYAKIDRLHLYLGGDMVEGETVFAGQAHEIDQSVYDQAVNTAPTIFARMVLRWLETVPTIRIIGVPGNHGRSAPKNINAHPKSNWDLVCYAVLRMMLLGSDLRPQKEMRKRIEFEAPERWYVVDDVLGWKNLILHGQQIRGMIGGPAFARQLMGWRDSVKESWDNFYFGHFHVYKQGDLNGRWWFCNGTTESDNDYALERLSSSTTPRQRLQFFDREHGVVQDHPVYLRYGLDG